MRAELEDLRRFAPDDHLVLTISVNVPTDPAGAKGTIAKVKDLLQPIRRDLEGLPREVATSLRSDIDHVAADAERFSARAGSTITAVHCSARGLHSEFELPNPTIEIAVAEPLPYLRAIDAGTGPRERVAALLVHKRRARIFELTDAGCDELEEITDEGHRDENHAGWYGLEEHKAQRHAAETTHRHYRSVAERLAALHAERSFDLLLLGGTNGAPESFEPFLTPELHAIHGGGFPIDQHAATAALVADACAELITQHRRDEDARLLARIAEARARGEGVMGLAAVAGASNLAAIDTLVVDADVTEPGAVCDRCSVVVLENGRCPTCDRPTRATRDVVGAIVQQTLRTAGSVRYLTDPDRNLVEPVGALLRFPLPDGTV